MNMEVIAPPVLSVRDLCVGFPSPRGFAFAAERVSFDLASNEILGLVGESGCGKSVTLRAIIGMVPRPGAILSGTARLAERELLSLKPRELRRVRGREVAMIFQDPASTINPVLTVGDQITEVLRKVRGCGRRAAAVRAEELLTRVGVPSARRRLRDYAHQLSGGMRQRVMIAIAVACDPAVLLADEPTTALDVSIQDQILALIADLQAESGMAVVLVSHDLGVIAQVCDHVAVMYAGRIIEYGSHDVVLDGPRHPYTKALMDARLDGARSYRRSELATIPGQVPDLTSLPPGCAFAPRCAYAHAACARAPMDLDRPGYEHGTACIRVSEGSL